MANRMHLKILKQGVDGWNKWREENVAVMPDLYRADLGLLNLNYANLSKAHLHWADFNTCDLIGANLVDADLYRANLMTADFTKADLTGAILSEADLYSTDLSMANLRNADLTSALVWNTNLNGTNLSGAKIGETIFSNTDLSVANGLDKIIHAGPSTLGIDTILRSKGNVSEIFLKGIGVPESMLDHIHNLPTEFFNYPSCFISYFTRDRVFAEQLYKDLQKNGVRCWYALEDLKIGDRTRQRIDQSIRSHHKLLLVLSEKSIISQWVEKKVETAFEEERKHKKTVLFPVRLDNSVIETNEAWASDIRRTRHIGDFTGWKDQDVYRKAFERLLKDLKAED